MRHRLIAAVALLGLAFAAAAQDSPRVRLATTMGDIVIEVDAQRAPKTAENFLAYVRDGYYDGKIFHRVIDGFMVQTGGFDRNFARGDTRGSIMNEADNGLKNVRGSVAMARTQDPHSAAAQFFINVADNDFLDHKSKDARGWGYAVFGRVVEGMEVVDAIKSVPTGRQGRYRDVPDDPIVIERASIEGA